MLPPPTKRNERGTNTVIIQLSSFTTVGGIPIQMFVVCLRKERVTVSKDVGLAPVFLYTSPSSAERFTNSHKSKAIVYEVV